MLFPTLEFLLFFVVVLALNQMFSQRTGWRKAMLIASSYVFYAAWDYRFLALMLVVTLIAYSAGLLLEKIPVYRRWIIGLSLSGLLGILGIFKYFNFFAISLHALFQDTAFVRDLTWMSFVLPVGISFYIFQAISYIVDVDRQKIQARVNLSDVMFYVSFFPQLVAGPIVRAADFMPQIDRPKPVNNMMRATATILILIGFAKKMIVANYLSVKLVDPVFAFPQLEAALTAWLAVLAYAVQIYCDFSGYSDIAIGVALLLGYEFKMNFNQPYRARSFREFWQRWHISLSSWIRDYLYIPLGGNQGVLARQGLVLLATMTLAGLWHGAGWNFLIWGFVHGLVLFIERLFIARGIMVERLSWYPMVVFWVVVLLWIPFRAPEVDTSLAMLRAMVRFDTLGESLPSVFILILLCIGLAMNWSPLTPIDWAKAKLGTLTGYRQAVLCATILAIGLFFCFALSQEGTAPFIYFQF